VIDALVYLQFQSVKNRTLTRLKRLRQPKYLLFAFVGGLYFYFYFFRQFYRMRNFGPGVPVTFAWSAETLALLELVGALVLCVIVVLAWIIPHQRAALIFTEAEIAFLFPAPISRQGLIHFKLLRSQLSILFTTLFLAFVTRRFAGHFWFRVAGWWLILSTLNLHLLGSSFARTLLLDRGVSNWKRRTGVAIFLAAVVGLVYWWGSRTLPTLAASPFDDVEKLKTTFRQLLSSGPAFYVLFPFRLVLRPYFSPDARTFLVALGPAVALLLAHYWWVVRSDVAFEEASVEASQKVAVRVAAIRSGNWQAARKPVKARKPPFRLKPSGLPLIALLWKNLISAGQAFTLRVWIILTIIGLSMSLGLAGSSQSGWRSVVAMLSAMFIVWTLLLGPQFLRQDLRHDLPRADILKMYPMRGWEIVLGELLAPAVILTGIQWFLLIITMALSAYWPVPSLPLSLRLGIGFSVAILVPLLNLITLQIPNASVLLLPAWFSTGKDRAQGIEATGQRIVFLLGSVIVFALSLVPASVACALVLWLGHKFAGWSIVVPLSAIAAAIVLILEAGAGILLLGWLFDRFDLTSEAAT
jgi:hypothetical protein